MWASGMIDGAMRAPQTPIRLLVLCALQALFFDSVAALSTVGFAATIFLGRLALASREANALASILSRQTKSVCFLLWERPLPHSAVDFPVGFATVHRGRFLKFRSTRWPIVPGIEYVSDAAAVLLDKLVVAASHRRRGGGFRLLAEVVNLSPGRRIVSWASTTQAQHFGAALRMNHFGTPLFRKLPSFGIAYVWGTIIETDVLPSSRDRDLA
jgi:GNAT superfamily N-acetyltransferase